jgi:hypothetical protein
MADVLAVLHARGHTAVLTEGGPHLIGNLLGESLLDELFLTTSPVLAGRADTSRPGLITGLELLPKQPAWADLISARRPVQGRADDGELSGHDGQGDRGERDDGRGRCGRGDLRRQR